MAQPEKKKERREPRNSLDKVDPRNAGAGGGQKGSGVVGIDTPRTFPEREEDSQWRLEGLAVSNRVCYRSWERDHNEEASGGGGRGGGGNELRKGPCVHRGESQRKAVGGGASLVAQWLRIRLPMQGTQVRALVREDPTCRGATKPVHHNYRA